MTRMMNISIGLSNMHLTQLTKEGMINYRL